MADLDSYQADSINLCPHKPFVCFINEKKYGLVVLGSNSKSKLRKIICCNTSICKIFSFFCTNFKSSSNSQYLLDLLHNLNFRCTKWVGKSFARKKERESEIKNLFRQLIKIQRQWCYRAPIKKLSLHWQWHLFQPLLTTLLVPVCESQPTASHSVFLWMKRAELTSFKHK